MKPSLLNPESSGWERAYAIIEPQIDKEGIHRWPFDPLFPIDVRFFIFGPGGGVRMNRHDYLEILYILQGEVKFQIQRRSVTARTGDLLVIGSTFFHRPVKANTASAKAAALYFKPEILCSSDGGGEDLEFLVPFMAEDGNFSHVVAADSGVPAEVLNFMKRIRCQLPAHGGRERLTVRTFLRTILILLVGHYSNLQLNLVAFNRRKDDIQRLRPLFELIDHSLERVITLKQAAGCVHMSKSHFTRFFRRVTGQPFVTYLHHLRIAKAQTLLTTTDRSIAEIGHEVGFCDQSYFGLIFHKIAGRTPRQFRNESRNGKFEGHYGIRELPPLNPSEFHAAKRALPPSTLETIRRRADSLTPISRLRRLPAG
jgi:AraC-like DNA-binding protein/quercetin dioxygenase-like cupin family protein